MKLNENGWGLKSLIVFGAIFIVLLIFVSISISEFFKNNSKERNSAKQNTEQSEKVESTPNRNVYTSIQVDIEEAAYNYIEYHPTLINNSNSNTIVSINTLISEDFLDKVVDPADQNKTCDGYVKIKSDGETKAFIKCSEYETLNYDLWVD